MNFDLSDEHRMLQETVRAFVAKEVTPRARHVDESSEFPWETLHAMGKLGLLGLNVPEAYGGSGADYLSVVLMLAEIGKGCGSTGLIVAAHLGLACGPLTLFGSEEQKRRWLVPMAQGKMLGCLGLTEPGAGCDLRGIRTNAVRDGDVVGHQRQQDVADQRRRGRGCDLTCAHRREVQPHPRAD